MNKFFTSSAARRAVSTAMAMAIVCSMSVPTFAVSRSTLENLVFNSSYYASHNLDVVRALGSSASALKEHYNTYGRNEGRAPSDVFDPQFYLAAYPDLRAAFGNNYSAALEHFIRYGISEGRQGSSTFNLEIYKDNYADLRQAFGTSSSDNWEYIQHWVQYGRNEHRNAVTRLSSTSSDNSTTNNVSVQTTSVKYIKTSNTASRVNVRSGPSTGHKSLGKLSYGTRVDVLSESGGWSKIRTNGLTGFVSSEYLSSINPNRSTPIVLDASTLNTVLTSPVPKGAKFSRKTNDNGWNGYHDINRNISINTPVYAVTNGVAKFYQYHSHGKLRSYGNYVKFVSSDGQLEVRYAHLSRFNGVSTPITTDSTYPCSGANTQELVATRNVSAGEVLGFIGTTGNSSGLHLHIEVYKNGKRVDPTTVFSGLI